MLCLRNDAHTMDAAVRDGTATFDEVLTASVNTRNSMAVLQVISVIIHMPKQDGASTVAKPCKFQIYQVCAALDSHRCIEDMALSRFRKAC